MNEFIIKAEHANHTAYLSPTVGGETPFLSDAARFTTKEELSARLRVESRDGGKRRLVIDLFRDDPEDPQRCAGCNFDFDLNAEGTRDSDGDFYCGECDAYYSGDGEDGEDFGADMN